MKTFDFNEILDTIKRLHYITNRGMMDCKKMYEECDGNFDEAVRRLTKSIGIPLMIHRVIKE